MQGLSSDEIEEALTAILPDGVTIDSIEPCIIDAENIELDNTVFYYGNVRVSSKKTNRTNKAIFYSGAAEDSNINLRASNLPEQGGYYRNVLFSQVTTKDANVIFEGYKITCSGGGISDSEGGVLDI